MMVASAANRIRRASLSTIQWANARNYQRFFICGVFLEKSQDFQFCEI
jgi:hypothetical protein